MSNLQIKLNELMTQKKLSTADIERETGLNRNTVYSIISGTSKNPSAYNLQLIAKALGVNIESLLLDETDIKTNIITYEQMKVFADAAHATVNIVIKKEMDCSLNKLISLIKEVYEYSLKSNPPCVDEKFIDWLLDKEQS